MALAVEECALPIRTRRLNPSLDNAYGVMPQGPGLANLQQLRIIRSFRSPVFAAALIGFSIFSWMPANAQTPPGLVPPGITYVRSVYNWSQSPTNPTTLSAMSPVSVTLTPCPTGIDTTSRAGYQVLVSGGGNSEVVNVVPTAGDCTPGASTGTIHFTPFNGYPAGYTVGSASSGIQETINYACGINQTTFLNAQCNVTIPANNYEIGTPTPPPSSNTYNVYGTIFLHSNQSVLSGYGVSLNLGVGTASGATPYSYFVVAKDCPSGNTCPPYPSQTSPMQVLNYNSTQNDSIPVLFPRVANGTDSITYDLLRTTTPVGVGAAYPSPGNCNGGSTAACGYIATLGQCSGLVCAYTDSGAAVTQSYNIAVGDYSGDLNFWPGSIVSLNKSVVTDGEAANIVGVGLAGNPIQVAGKCTDYGTASPGGYTACLASLSTQDVAYQSATILTDGAAVGGAGSNQYFPKGRLNFSTTPFATLQPHEIITLIDSQPGLTQATWGYRPQAGTGTTADTWIGTDVVANGTQLTNGQLAFGAPVSISNYIDAVPNSTGYNPSTNWLTQLTAAGFALRTHLNQFSTGQFAGTCTMQNATTCTITVAARYTSTPGCVVTVQGSSPIAGACSVTGTTVTVTAASNNSATWAAMLFGNPN